MNVGLDEKVEVQSSEDTARELLGTGNAQDQVNPPSEPEQLGDQVQEDVATEQVEPEVDEYGNEIVKEVEPEETQGSEILREATERLNKVAGRTLSDEESLDMMSTSYMKADAKIQSLSEQLQAASTYQDRYEAIVNDPVISQVLNGQDPWAAQRQVDNGMDEEISPGMQKLIAGQNQQIQSLNQRLGQLSGGVQTNEQMQYNGKVKEMAIVIDDFAAKKDNADFKEMVIDYRENLKLNRRAPMPPMLSKVSAMLDNGVSIDEAWGVLNPAKVENRLKGNIATAQRTKLKRGGVAMKSKGKAPKLQDLSDLPELPADELMRRIVDNANARATGDE